jgi:hypothetical protein
MTEPEPARIDRRLQIQLDGILQMICRVLYQRARIIAALMTCH